MYWEQQFDRMAASDGRDRNREEAVTEHVNTLETCSSVSFLPASPCSALSLIFKVTMIYRSLSHEEMHGHDLT